MLDEKYLHISWLELSSFYEICSQVAQQYQQIAGHSLEKAIKKEFSGDIKNGLLAILKYSMNKSEFFAELLHKSMVGLGTNDSQLIRLLVTRCEIDLNDIKTTFQQKYGKSLRSWIDVSIDTMILSVKIIILQHTFVFIPGRHFRPLPTLSSRTDW